MEPDGGGLVHIVHPLRPSGSRAPQTAYFHLKFLVVTADVNSITTTDFGNVTNVAINYTLYNPTNNLINEGSFKLYYKYGGGLPQYGFFGQLFPGQAINRSYTFNVESLNIPFILGYPGGFFANTWLNTELTYEIP